jgi:hypothetical protein
MIIHIQLCFCDLRKSEQFFQEQGVGVGLLER